MTRFAITADNQLVQEAQLSFADIRLQARRYHNIFASPERAYVMSNTDWKLFEWDQPDGDHGQRGLDRGREEATDADSDAQDAVVYAVTPDGVEGAFRVPGGDL